MRALMPTARPPSPLAPTSTAQQYVGEGEIEERGREGEREGGKRGREGEKERKREKGREGGKGGDVF
jgi:hypothetical protein